MAVPRLLAALLLLTAGCGAEALVAPPAEVRQDARSCQSFEALMPNFQRALETGQTQHLKTLVETQLTVAPREGAPPHINEVLRVIFTRIEAFALKPGEPGAARGALCAPDEQPPPLAQANELCELRRALRALVHEGRAIDAVDRVEPALKVLLDYLTGTGNDCRGRPRVAHYEVAAELAAMCSQDAHCQMDNGLKLTVAFTNYLSTGAGSQLLDHLIELVQRPAVAALLDTSNSALTEEGMVALVRVVVPVLQSADSQAVRDMVDQLPLPDDVKAELDPLIGDLMVLVDDEALMTPLKAVLNCHTRKDTHLDLVRMFYRLGIEEQCEAMGLRELLDAVSDVREVDQRGSLVWIIGRLAQAQLGEVLAIDSTAAVCRTVFSTQRAAGAARSNAELALPELGQLVHAGVIHEGICAIDTLLFGCAGDAQPACR